MENLKKEIEKLKKEKNAVLLAHYYVCLLYTSVKGKHIDVFFKSHKQTKRFGKKTGVKVYKVN